MANPFRGRDNHQDTHSSSGSRPFQDDFTSIKKGFWVLRWRYFGLPVLVWARQIVSPGQPDSISSP